MKLRRVRWHAVRGEDFRCALNGCTCSALRLHSALPVDLSCLSPRVRPHLLKAGFATFRTTAFRPRHICSLFKQRGQRVAGTLNARARRGWFRSGTDYGRGGACLPALRRAALLHLGDGGRRCLHRRITCLAGVLARGRLPLPARLFCLAPLGGGNCRRDGVGVFPPRTFCASLGGTGTAAEGRRAGAAAEAASSDFLLSTFPLLYRRCRRAEQYSDVADALAAGALGNMGLYISGIPCVGGQRARYLANADDHPAAAAAAVVAFCGGVFFSREERATR